MLDEGTPRASALLCFLDEPTSSMGTILFVYTVAMCAAAAAAFWIDLDIWSVSPWLAIVLALLQLLVLMLVQFLGRVFAVARPESVALTFVRPVEVLNRVLFVVLVPLNALDRWMWRLLGVSHGMTPT